jgi:hypothetical protein
MRLKHGSKLRMIVTDKKTDKKLQEDIIHIEELNSYLTVLGILYNGKTMSGGIDWRHPITSRSIKPQWKYELVDPTDELKEDEECDCEKCEIERNLNEIN